MNERERERLCKGTARTRASVRSFARTQPQTGARLRAHAHRLRCNSLAALGAPIARHVHERLSDVRLVLGVNLALWLHNNRSESLFSTIV